MFDYHKHYVNQSRWWNKLLFIFSLFTRRCVTLCYTALSFSTFVLANIFQQNHCSLLLKGPGRGFYLFKKLQKFRDTASLTYLYKYKTNLYPRFRKIAAKLLFFKNKSPLTESFYIIFLFMFTSKKIIFHGEVRHYF